ncbi:MAG: NUDIX hydrolase N-terminal domain-containing protein [Chloroflexota bacterium]
MENASLAQQIALWSDRLRDMSAMGLLYSPNIYDRENYQQIQQIAMQMLAVASAEPLPALEALRGPVFNRPTPLVTGDAAIIDDAGRILLIQRADNRLWAMPGGALSTGETPAEGALREALEETGWRCEARSLIGVFDSRYIGAVSRHQLYMFQFLCRPVALEHAVPPFANEILGMDWFSEAQVPEALDPGHRRRIPLAFQAWKSSIPAYFDRPG